MISELPFLPSHISSKYGRVHVVGAVAEVLSKGWDNNRPVVSISGGAPSLPVLLNRYGKFSLSSEV